MGTPASVACDSPQWPAPVARARKRASANIFEDMGPLQLRSLFQRGGDERAEERARLVWEYAGDRRTAHALRQLRSRQRRRRQQQPPQLGPATQDGTGGLSLQQFSHPRLEDRNSSCAEPGSSLRDGQHPGPAREGPRTRQRKRGPGPIGYLHQLQR